MKLKSITVENFRQFYDKQTIEFSSNEKNVTIIFGENGKGKTGIFRALIFGLFGEIYLAQDNIKDKIHLVNFIKLEENEGLPVSATVEVKFENKDKSYSIKRTVQGFKTRNIIEERVNPAKLFIIDENGNISSEPIEDEVEIKGIINGIIDEKIKDFFLFDAEKIETLAKTDTKVKEEVKLGIVKLLQIDKLDKGISILKSLYNKENKSIVEKSSNLDLKNKEKQINNIEIEIKNLEEKAALKEENLILCKKEIEENELLLEENEEIRKVQEKVKVIKDKKNDKLQSLKYLKQALKNEHLNQGHMIFMKDSYLNTKTYLNQVISDQKDLIAIEVIEKSLKDMVCSCCKTDLSKEKETFENVLKMKENYRRSEMTPLISEINGTIHEFNKINEDITNGIKKKLINIRYVKDEIEELNRSLDRLKDKVKEFSNNEKNLKEIENRLDEKKKLLSSLEGEIQRLNIELEIKEKELDKFKREYNDLMEKDSALRYDYKKLEYIEKIKLGLEKIFNEYSEEMRNKLMKETTDIFRKLIDPKDKNLIECIRINEKYEIELYNWAGTKITQDLSQGQKQVMSLSFITALAKVAAGGTENVDFPLFMDTPFGRISGNNRDNLIENIPNLTAQWILLLTDTEFTLSEEIKIKSTNKLGRWYKLEQIKPGCTRIVEVPLNDQLSTRR